MTYSIITTLQGPQDNHQDTSSLTHQVWLTKDQPQNDPENPKGHWIQLICYTRNIDSANKICKALTLLDDLEEATVTQVDSQGYY